jgi:hypothetical protein
MTRTTIARLIAAVATASLALAGTSGAATLPHRTAVQTKALITTNYEAFFKGTTPAKTKIKLLQHGSEFTTIIDAQSISSLAKSTTAKVTRVTINSSSRATVKYSIYLAGKSALTNQTGQAVYAQGTWQVGTTSFCALLSLEGTKTKACPAS